MSLSIIIPSYNDGKHVLDIVKSLHYEVTVIESGDTTYFGKLPKHVKAFKGEKGRGRQMNLGARRSKGDVLLFLHADSDIAKLDLTELEKLTGNFWGCFRIAFNSSKKYFRFIAWNSNIRSKYFHTVFGDQGLFISRKLFEQIGGFDEKAAFEDVEISSRLKKIQKNIIMPQIITSSPRRFEKHGIIRTHLIMGAIIISLKLGMPKLAKVFYKLIS